MENRPEYLVSWAGLAKVGVTAALINTNLVGTALRHALAAAGTGTLVIGTECLDRFATTADDLERPLETWLVHERTGAAVPTAVPSGARDLDEELSERSAENPDPLVREELCAADDIFYIYTSGTTGLPKAAHFSHLRFVATGLAGAFALGVFTERPGQLSAIVGVATGIGSVTLMREQMAWPWYVLLGSIVTFEVGWLAGLVESRRTA